MKQTKRSLCTLFAFMLFFTVLAAETSSQKLLPDRDGSPPVVENLNPAENAVGVATNTDITFDITDVDGDVDISSVTVTVTSTHDGVQTFNEGTGNFFYSGNQSSYSVTITPPGDFRAGETITINIDASDVATNNVIKNYHFDTVPDTQSPYAGGFSPANDATSVAVNTNLSFDVYDSGIGVDDATIVVTINSYDFDGNHSTYNNQEFTVGNGGITGVSGDYSHYQITIDPVVSFDTAGEEVYWEIDASDLNGLAMGTVYKHFTIISESRPPEVQNPSPISGASNVARDTNIAFDIYDEFDQHNNVDLESITVEVIRNANPGTTYNSSNPQFSYTENQYGYHIIVDPSPTEAENFFYYDEVTIKINAYDLSNFDSDNDGTGDGPNVMPEEVYSFRIVDDIIPPSISNVVPANNATNIAHDTDIEFTLSDAGYGVDDSSVQVTITDTHGAIIYSSGSNPTKLTFSGDNSELGVRVDPLNNFDWTDDIQVDVYAKDLRDPAQGNNELNYSFTFEIQQEDNVAPYVTNLAPADAATDIPVDTDIIFDIVDAGDDGVDQGTIVLKVEGLEINNASYTTTAIAGGFHIVYDPGEYFDFGQIVNINVLADDGFVVPNSMNESFSFTCKADTPPTVDSPIADFAFDEDTSHNSIDLDNVFGDVDLTVGDNLTYSYSGNTNIGVSIAVDGVVTLTPVADWSGAETITFTATDEYQEFVTDEVVVTINNTNDSPTVANAIVDFSFIEDTENSSIDLNSVFTDLDLNYGDGLAFTNSGDSNISVAINAGIVTLTPDANWVGSETITFTATDNSAAFISDDVLITITNVNDAPIVANALVNFSFAEDTDNSSINLNNVFSDADADILTFTYSGNVNIGVVINNGVVTLDPVQDWSGSETITFIAKDSSLAQVSNSVVVTINNTNDVPTVANALVDFNFAEDTANSSIDLNDVFADVDLNYGDGLTFTHSGDSNISVAIDAGIVTLTPDVNWVGDEDITFIATDTSSASISDVVNVVINNVNDYPTVVSPIVDFSFAEDTVDTSIDLDTVFGDADIAYGDALTYSFIGNVNIDVVIANDGVVTLTPTSNWNGAEEITFVASDQSLTQVSNAVTVTITNVNDTPTIDLPLTYSFNEDNSPTVDYSVYIADADENDNLTLTATTVSGNHINVDINDFDVTFSVIPDWNGTENITFAVNDNIGRAIAEDVIAVTSTDYVNNAPTVVAALVDFSFNEDSNDSSINLNNVFDDVDIPFGDILTFTYSGNQNIDVSIANDGEVTLTPESDWFGSETITFFATDNALAQISDSVIITINNENDAPTVANVLVDFNFDEDSSNSSLNLNNVFEDADNDVLSFSNTGNTNIAVSITDGIVTFTPISNWSGNENITFIATDTSSAFISDEVNVVINNVNDAPIVENAILDFSFAEDTVDTSIDLDNVFSDVDITYGDVLTYSYIGNVNIDVAIANDGVVTLTPTSNWIGEEEITFVASDQSLAQISNAVTITITNVNDEPVLDLPLTYSFNEDTTPVVDFTDYITDIDPNDNLVLSAVNSANISVSISNFEVTYSVTPDWNGTENIEFSINDNGGRAVDTKTISVTVNYVNDAPIVENAIADFSFAEDTADTSIDLDNVFADADIVYGDVLTFSSFGNSHIGVSIAGNGVVTLTPENDWIGTETITFTAVDNFGYQISDEVDVEIINVNDSPIMNLPATLSFNEDESLIENFNQYLTDIDEDNLYLSATDSDNISVAIDGLNVTFTATSNWSGSETIQFSVSDVATRATDSGSVLVTVDAVDDAPFVETQILDVTADEDAANQVIDISGVFGDIDSDVNNIIKSLMNNSNPSLVSVSVINNEMTINFLDDANGTADITVRGTSEGKVVDDIFTITVNPIDDAPYVVSTISDVDVDEDAAQYDVNLSGVFGDIDNDNNQIFESVLANSNQSVVNTSITNEMLTLTFIENKSGSALITIQALSNLKTVTTSFNVVVNSVDDDPVIDIAITDIIVDEDANDDILFLSDVFTDIDNDDSNIVKSIISNSDPTLIDIEIDGNIMTIDYLQDQNGTATIQIEGESNGKTVIDEFIVNVLPVDDAPTVGMGITDVFTVANVPPIVKNLSTVFTDVDNDDFGIAKTVINNTNSSLVTTSLVGNDLTLELQENQSGSATITIRGTSNNKYVDDEFMVIVTSDSDALIVENPIPDQNVNEDAQNINLDISDVFKDLSDENANISKSLNSNSNEELVSVTVVGNTMILQIEPNQHGESLISLQGVSDGKVEYDDFVLTVASMNDAPTIELPNSLSFDEDNSLVVDFAIYTNDIDGDELVLNYSNNSNVYVSIDGLMVTFTATENWAGSEPITFTVEDPSTSSSSDVVVIGVNPVNDLPVADAGGQYLAVSDDTGFASVDLDGRDSFDVDGTITSYLWEWNGGIDSINGSEVTVLFPEGTTEVTLTVTDNEGAVDSNMAYINVNSEDNQQPIALQDTFYVNEETLLSVSAANGVLLNDSDDDYPEALTAYLVDGVSHGSLTFLNDGSFEYTPDMDFAGEDTFTYKAYDGQVYSTIEVVKIVVNQVNDDPVIALNASYSFAEDEQLIVDFEDYTSDVDLDILSLTIANNSDVQYSINGLVVTFTATENWNGTENISITVDDGNSGIASANTNIIVTPINDRPIAADNSYFIDEDETLTVTALTNLLINDTDVETPDNLNSYISTNVQNGALTLNTDGTFTYQPNEDFNGADAFTYFASDGDMNSLPATVNIYINPINDTPTIDLPTTITFDEDYTYQLDLSVFADDIDGDQLDVAISGDSFLNYSIENLMVSITPDQDWVGTEQLTFTVTDPSNTSASDQVQFTITQINDAPIAVADTYNTNEDQAVMATLANSLILNDIDDNYPSTLSAEMGQSPLHGDITLDTNGTFVYNPEENYFGIDTFTYRVTDTDLYSEYETVTINIAGVNDAPTIIVTDPVIFNEDSSIQVDFTQYVNDIDGDELSITVDNTDFISTSIDGMIITFSADADWNGSENITVNVSDLLENDSAIVQVLVNPVNDSPIAINDNYFAVEDQLLTIGTANGLLDNDTDDDYPDEMTAVLVNNVTHGVLSFNENGSFNYQGEENFIGDDYFSYKAFDGSDYSNLSIVTINVSADNDAPVITLPVDITFAEDDNYVQNFQEFISDVDNNINDITLMASNYNHVNVEIDGFIVTLTPEENWNGVEVITFIVDDGSATNSSSQQNVSIVINAINDAPVLADIINQTMIEDEGLTIPIQVSDVDNDVSTLNFSAECTDDHFTVDVQGLFLVITSELNWVGQTFITLNVDDGTGTDNDSDSDSFLLSIVPQNDAPEVTAEILDMHSDEDFVQSIVVNLDNYFTDIDGDNIEYSVDYADTEIDAEIDANQLVLNSIDDWNGITSITVTASDDAVEPLSISDTFTLTLLAINDAPVLTIIPDQDLDEDNELVYTIEATDVDNTNLTYSADTISDNIELSLNGAELTITPADDWNGEAVITVLVEDISSEDSQSFRITVNPVNDAPFVQNNLGAVNVDEDFVTPITKDLDYYFGDVDGDNLVYSAAWDTTMVDVEINNNLLSINSVLNANGSTSITITADDNRMKTINRDTVSDNLIINIAPVNDAPVIDLPLTLSFDEDSVNQRNLEDYISDVDEDELTLLAINTDNIFVEINGLNATFTSTENWNGTETIVFNVNDETGRIIATDEIQVSIEYVNDAPFVQNELVDFEFDEDTTYSELDLNDVFNDYDLDYGDQLIFTYSNNDSIDVEINDGVVTFTPNPNWYGEETIQFTATDNSNEYITDFVVVTVNNVNDDPVLDLDGIETDFESGEIVFNEGGQFVIDFADYVTDIDQNNLSVLVTGNVDLEIEIVGLVVTITTPDFWSGSEILTFTITDGETRAQVQVTLKVIVVAQYGDERVELEHHTISWNNPTSKFDITTKRDVGEIKGRIFDRNGRLVKKLEVTDNGDKKVASWDAKASNGSSVNGGFYIYQFKIAGKVYQGSIIVAR